MSKQLAYLVLEDGTLMKGKAFGAQKASLGEVVFQTGMTGYQEVLSDPGACEQIITMTFPLIGNYGLNRDDFQALAPVARGLIVKEHALFPNNWRQESTLEAYLKEYEIPGIYDVDTRKLTRLLRERGTMKGVLVSGLDLHPEEAQALIKSLPETKEQVAKVSTKQAYHCPGTGYKIVVVDFGVKTGVLRELINRHCDLQVVPYQTTAEEIIRMRPDGVLLSNGPGDPQGLPEAVQMIKEISAKFPVFGIGLGHQLFCLAFGASTEKMTFGHRGANHPVKDLQSGKIMMTSQNHGYVVQVSSLANTELEITHIAVNDHTLEGVRHRDYPAFSVQFHPQGEPGPADGSYLFDEFLKMIEEEASSKGGRA